MTTPSPMHREPDPGRSQPAEGESAMGEGISRDSGAADGAEPGPPAELGPRAWHGGSMAYRPDLERAQDGAEQSRDGGVAPADQTAPEHSTSEHPTPEHPVPAYPTTAPTTTEVAQPEPSWRARGLVALAAAAAIAVLGFPLGWLWSSVAP